MTCRIGRWLSLTLVCAVGIAAGAAETPPSWTDDLAPISPRDWTYERAAHLIERAGFGDTPDEIARLAATDPAAGGRSARRLRGDRQQRVKPFDESGIWDPGMDPFPPSRAEAVRIGARTRRGARRQGAAGRIAAAAPAGRRQVLLRPASQCVETQRLGVWWATRMLVTRAAARGEADALLARSLRDRRREGARLPHDAAAERDAARARLGQLRDLLVGILKDPAMLVYLDNGENIKKHPNENFGRELLELFSMGVGHYTERDVREAARAFTGWTNDVLAFKFDARAARLRRESVPRPDRTAQRRGHHRHHSRAAGHGRVRGREVVSILRPRGCRRRSSGARPGVPRERLSDEAAPEADVPVEGFLQRASFATQIKSPVALVISTYKKMGLRELPTIPDFGRMTGGLGQSLFDPPNVAGWAGGRTWITPATLFQRGNLFRDVLFPDGRRSARRIARCRRPTRASASSSQKGEEHHRGDEGRHGRRGVEHDGRPRRGLQHAVRQLPWLPDGVRAYQADPAAHCRDRPDGDDGRRERDDGRRRSSITCFGGS